MSTLTQTLFRIENSACGITAGDCTAFLDGAGANSQALAAAAELKRLAGQINVTIHALGILLCLPHILEPGERVAYVSLGAGNTGRKFDLETNLRVAEFKFIHWRGGAEAIRQNSVFKDYLHLAEDPTPKHNYLYLLGVQHALNFFEGGRALSSIMRRNAPLQSLFSQRFGTQFRTVGEYYAANSHAVRIEDVSPWLSELAGNLIADPIDDDCGG